ncbi:UDP-glucuronosyl/UDP-glucosyltransferase [Corchorus olitorius]|uniref:UDP-glucuronosyl/UDP-glucosyltransferase n=1 Tax=Corchorus olitorius TaxID=93759 RepID=A0A1R3IRH4_9ROSI|nr:UDP-glucuronosyl/UDP-glucosyltransferase [Corchorus olitorius]
METTEESKSLHVAMALTPGIGHLIPLLEFAKRLVIHQPNFEVTIFIPNDGSPMKYQKQLLQALPKSISTIFLPPVSFDDLPHDVKAETRIVLSLVRSIPALKDSLKVLLESTRLVALVVDLFGIDAVYDVSKELEIKPYIFFPTNAMVLQLVFHMPKYDQMFSCESYSDLVEPIKLPGCVPFQGRDIPESVREKKSVTYQGIIRLCKYFSLAAGIMVNSFMDLEQDTFDALMSQVQGDEFDIPVIYPVGPLVQTSSSSSSHGSNNCLRWLNEQPDGSVVYVSFGSGGTLSSEQMNELAIGLEMSGQRFIWVVKSPNEKAKNATYFGVDSLDDDPVHFLPDGDKMRKLKDAAKLALSAPDGSSTKSLAKVAEIWNNQGK